MEISGDLVSKPYVDTTISVMKNFGVEVQNNNYKTFTILPQKYFPIKYQIQGDASSASYFLSAAAICGGKIVIENVGSECNQGDIKYAEILRKMGAKVKIEKNCTILESNGKLHGIEVDMNEIPDVAPTLAVTALFAEGKTVIKNIANLRIKETDRILAIENELKKLNAKVETGKDIITILPSQKYSGCIIDTYDDHRIGMSFALAGLKINGVKINNPDVVSKSYPNFWDDFNKLY